MLQVHDTQAFHEDGTPRRKYEIDDSGDRRAGLRAAVGVALLTIAAFIKNVVSAQAQEKNVDQGSDDASRGYIADDTLTASDQAPSERVAPEQTLSGSVRPLVFRASPSEIVSIAPEIKARRGNDSAPDYTPAAGQSAATAPNVIRPEFGVGRNANSQGQFTFTTTEPTLQFDDPPDVVDDAQPPSTPDVLPPSTPKANRRPVTTGTLSLGTIIFNTHILIALAGLLENASDPDGDRLAVHDLSVSSGTLTVNFDNSWHYLPAYNDERTVVFTYRISDGEADVWQTAVLNIDPHSINQIDGTADRDDIVGSVRDDLIRAGSGDDLILARGGDDVIHGGDGDDRIEAGAGADVVFAGAGDDFVLGGDGDDFISGESGNDILFGEAGRDVLSGGEGNDLIYGGEGADVVNGGDGQDTIDGGVGNDVLAADDGDDVVLASKGRDTVDGGAGRDTYNAAASTARIVANLEVGTVEQTGGDGARLLSVENIATGSGNDHVTGSREANVIQTGAGNDGMTASAGNDQIDGGDGIDTVDASHATTAVVANLSSGTVSQGDLGASTVSAIENISTGAGNDTITGNSDANEIDTGGGDDHVDAGSGDDVVIATAGDDHIDGGEGRDTYNAARSNASVTIDLVNGTARGNDTGRDVICSIEVVITGMRDDIVTCDGENNVISTGQGNDTVDGGAGSDTIDAGDGSDTIVLRLDQALDDIDGGGGVHDTLDMSDAVANLLIDLTLGIVAAAGETDTINNIEDVICGSGNDRIIANYDVNILFGGSGDDVFVFNSSESTGFGRGNRDRIMDFEYGDQVDIDHLSNEFQDRLYEGSAHFTLLAEGLKFAKPGELRFRYDDFEGAPRAIVLEGNLDRDEDSEFEIEFSGDLTMIESYLSTTFGNEDGQTPLRLTSQF
jgi:Ca2+-binding RTX toxin-like protein